ncbi:BZ3500_MvSof-1268-A1-R1_Chr5-2g07939 [Microbotryum saponariae]|uniref:BZ3500_MvSof-1268-A1-R1_Chr5-2g07939 protein n=1 Tax=Microbotryum saponariae TaxID=289078 RepID=A0A2X0LKX3_9BASI|nr:BZ3500_MvSof-1268-A1-R1_Chr5-2g07939 [Microbotryum saponariae]SDA05808.1 BZ3501_MvSof-1269-A2-R1_Chr5-2g07761 [Microbotryum saponariae]
MSKDSSAMSPRALSLAAVCLQSTVLAIVLHISQAKASPGERSYKASSAVLLTELGKLLLSLLLALRDVWKERATLLAPRHALPSPELYSSGYENGKDKYSLPPDAAPPESRRHTLRRRSSAISLDLRIEHNEKVRRLSGKSALAAFQWPRTMLSPVPDMKGSPLLCGSPEIVKRLNDPTLWTRRRRLGLRAMLWEDIFGSDWWKMGIPAVLFAVQNNLIYVAARNLSIPVFQITFQIKTVVTALCAVVMLGRRLTALQWVTLITLGAGVASMQLGAIHAKSGGDPGHSPNVSAEEDMNHLAGVGAVLVSCLASAIAATYFELVIKKPAVVPQIREYMMVAPPDLKPASLWVRNIQLSLFSTLFGIAVVLVQASPAHFAFHGGLSLDFKGTLDPLEHWYDPFSLAADGFFEGFNSVTWFVVALQTIGGLLIALAIKYADNVAKSFALSVSIVFTFLLSVLMFDFQVTPSTAIGALAVVGSTMLFEVDQSALKSAIMLDGHKRAGPLLRRWHYVLLVVLGTSFLATVTPLSRFSVTTAAWDALSSHVDLSASSTQPTIAIADMVRINAYLARGAGPGEGECDWGLSPLRLSTRQAFGPTTDKGLAASNVNFPYYEFETGQYSLDDILATRMTDYAHNVPILASPSPDFIFLPLLSLFYSNPWNCESKSLQEGIRQTTEYIRAIVHSVGKTAYPRIILPIAGVRSDVEDKLFTPELMEEFKDSVVVVSIESAPKRYPEALKYLIDVPYPTWFHLSTNRAGRKPGTDDYFLLQNRPNLVFYAAAVSHPWGAPASEPFNGFALRQVLQRQFSNYVALPAEQQTSRVIFEDLKVDHDGSQDFEGFHSSMASSVFCPMPAGDSPTRRALYEAALLGCIPVIFRERSYGRLFPSSPEINDLSRWTVYVDEHEMIEGVGQGLIERLEAITPYEIQRLQRHLASIAAGLQWSVLDEDQWYPPARVSHTNPGVYNQTSFYNHTKSIEQQRRASPVIDAFSLLVKELEGIRDGTWRAGIARDHRVGKHSKHFGKSAAHQQQQTQKMQQVKRQNTRRQAEEP